MNDQYDLLIRGGRIVTPEGIVSGDVGIRDGKIIAVVSTGDQNRAIAKREIQAKGRWVLPGGVDSHAHIEQMSGMGQWNADTFESATRSAAMGGTTSVISFAAQTDGEALSETVANYSARAARGAMIDYAHHLTITDLSVPGFVDDLRRLIDQGHRSLKIFTTYNIQLNDAEILQVMTLARQHGALVCVHAENDALIERARNTLIEAGKTAPRYHAESHPRMAEIEAIGRMCRFAEFLDQPVMIFHISTREGVDLVKAARARGAPVWAETCPHYLLMTDEVLDRPGLEGAKWMCSPPQRQSEDQEALWSGLAAGHLQLVSSDHAPYRFDESGKLSFGPNAGFHQIANGLPGLETRLPVLFDEMVSRGRSNIETFVHLTSTAPAELYGLRQKGSIAAGMDADIAIWNPDKTYKYGVNDLHDNVGYNPWEGREIRGWPECVILRGAIVQEDGRFLGEPGQGQWIDRPTLATEPGGRAPVDSWIE
jgi:dihydropyrimidinase